MEPSSSHFSTENSHDLPLHLYEGEVQALNLFNKDSGVSEKLTLLEKIIQSLNSSLEDSFNALGGNGKTCSYEAPQSFDGTEKLKEVSLEKSIISLWKNPQGEEEGLLLIDRVLFFAFYNQLLGGQRPYEKKGKLSPLEQDYLSRILSSVFEVLSHHFSLQIALGFKLKENISDESALSSIKMKDEVLLVQFNIAQADQKYGMSLWLPKNILQLFKESNAAEVAPSTQVNNEEDSQWKNKSLEILSDDEQLKVQLSAMMAEFEIPLKKALNLQVGDFLPLDIHENQFPVLLNQKTAFYGSLGTVGDLRAVKIN